MPAAADHCAHQESDTGEGVSAAGAGPGTPPTLGVWGTCTPHPGSQTLLLLQCLSSTSSDKTEHPAIWQRKRNISEAQMHFSGSGKKGKWGSKMVNQWPAQATLNHPAPVNLHEHNCVNDPMQDQQKNWLAAPSPNCQTLGKWTNIKSYFWALNLGVLFYTKYCHTSVGRKKGCFLFPILVTFFVQFPMSNVTFFVNFCQMNRFSYS